jgi:hypothetical protein
MRNRLIEQRETVTDGTFWLHAPARTKPPDRWRRALCDGGKMLGQNPVDAVIEALAARQDGDRTLRISVVAK